jgi:hypothetical protein
VIWATYVVLAGDLVRRQSEAAKRSGVSRSYYGAFNYARRWLEGRGTPIAVHRAHSQVWASFMDADQAAPGRRSRQLIGELGRELRRLRNQADYSDVMPRLDVRAVESVAIAQQIITLLDELEFS